MRLPDDAPVLRSEGASTLHVVQLSQLPPKFGTKSQVLQCRYEELCLLSSHNHYFRSEAVLIIRGRAEFKMNLLLRRQVPTDQHDCLGGTPGTQRSWETFEAGSQPRSLQALEKGPTQTERPEAETWLASVLLRLT